VIKNHIRIEIIKAIRFNSLVIFYCLEFNFLIVKNIQIPNIIVIKIRSHIKKFEFDSMYLSSFSSHTSQKPSLSISSWEGLSLFLQLSQASQIQSLSISSWFGFTVLIQLSIVSGTQSKSVSNSQASQIQFLSLSFWSGL